jgi:hypothetical protein
MSERKNYDDKQTCLDRYYRARELVNQQAEDNGLWFISDSIEINYLQQELRRIHAVLEGE